MTNLPQEFDASGIPSLRPYLNTLLENGLDEDVKWGKSERYVIIIEGRNINIRAGTTVINIMEIKVIAIYITMSNESSNKSKYY